MADWPEGSTLINDALRRSAFDRGAWGLFTAEHTTGLRPWFSSALSRMVLLLDDDDIVYASAAPNETGIAAVIVSEHLIITVERRSEHDATVTARPRTIPASISISEAGSFRTESGFADWPGTFAIQVNFDGLELNLPLGPADGANRRELADLTASMTRQMREDHDNPKG